MNQKKILSDSGHWTLDPSQIHLVKVPFPKTYRDVLRLLEGYEHLNERTALFLKDNQWLIPESWSGRMVVFLGSTLRDGGVRYFQALYPYPDKWTLVQPMLDHSCTQGSTYAAVLKPPIVKRVALWLRHRIRNRNK